MSEGESRGLSVEGDGEDESEGRGRRGVGASGEDGGEGKVVRVRDGYPRAVARVG